MELIICKPLGVCQFHPLTPPSANHSGYFWIEHGWHDATGMQSIHSMKALGYHRVQQWLAAVHLRVPSITEIIILEFI